MTKLQSLKHFLSPSYNDGEILKKLCVRTYSSKYTNDPTLLGQHTLTVKEGVYNEVKTLSN